MKKSNLFIIIAFLFSVYSMGCCITPCMAQSSVTSSTQKESFQDKESCKECKNQSSNKKQSTTQKLCSSITNILTNEIDKTKNKTKSSILKNGLKYTNEICGKGGTPDLTKITEGLPEQDKLRITQKANAVLFDGVDPNLTDKIPASVSGTMTRLSGKDGKITDLSSYAPTLPAAKANPVPKLKTEKSASEELISCICANYDCGMRNVEDCSYICSVIWSGGTFEGCKPISIIPPKPEKCPNPCYCGLYSNEPKCGLTDCEQLCVKEGYGCPRDKIFTIAEKCELKESKEGRSLTESEMNEAKKIFGDKLTDEDYKKIRLKTTGKGDPHTSGNTIYIPGYNPDQEWDRATLMHEMTHIYQKKNYPWWSYYPWKLVDFFLRKTIGLVDPMFVYRYELPYIDRETGKLVPTASLRSYRLEQQAAIVRDYYYGYKTWSKDKITPTEKDIMEQMLCKDGLLSKEICGKHKL